MRIHPTALVDPEAVVDSGVEIGPYAIVGKGVHIGQDCSVGSHAVLHGPLLLGAGNRIFPHAVLGLAPQDLKYSQEPTLLEIGGENTFREFCSVHRGTTSGRGKTSIGSRNLVMASCHIAHDAVIGDGCVLSSGVTLGGHVEIGDGAAVGGLTGIHQFARVGRQAFVGGCSAVDRDVVPFGLAAGNRAQLRNYNSVGLRRLGTSTETLERIRSLFRVLLDRRFNTGQVVSMLETEFDSPESREIVAFIKGSRRGILHGRRHSGQDLAP